MKNFHTRVIISIIFMVVSFYEILVGIKSQSAYHIALGILYWMWSNNEINIDKR